MPELIEDEIDTTETEQTTDSNSTVPTADKKQHNKTNAESRLTEKLTKLEQEVATYKAEKLERERAELSENERLKVEREEALAENQRLRTESARNKVASETGVAPHLIPSGDEDYMRLHAQQLLEWKQTPPVGSITNPTRITPKPQSIDDQIADADKKGDFGLSIMLKAQKLASATRN